MPDYDVGAVGLSSPPASAVIQAYRPAVSVRNNGVHDALAVGSLRIYSAGLLIFTTEIYSATIAPGETKPAQATDYWTPPALGRYQFIAYVSCINDQVEPNNNLAPCFVDVIPGEPTPPTPVALHAAQHEEGGGDELNIDGLHGRATDAQTPIAHKTSHQAGGADVLDVTGLLGTLGTPQPIADHHSTHENDGGDELNVDDLHGVLYNLQKPQVHANEAHDPNYSPDPHGNSYHSPAMMSLTGASYLRDVEAPPLITIDSLSTGTPLDVTIPADYLIDGDLLPIEALARSFLPSGGQPTIEFEIKHGAGDWQSLCGISCPIFSANPSTRVMISLRGALAVFLDQGNLVIQPTIEADFSRVEEETMTWYRLRNNYTTHAINATESQRIRLLFTTPIGDGNTTYFELCTLSRGRPNHPE